MISPANSPTPRRAARAAGFTLIEMIVVLAILGLTLTLIASYRPPWSRTLVADGAALQLAADLRLARAQAIVGNRPIAVSIDLPGHLYSVGGTAPRLIPAELRIELLTIANERESAGVADIRFNPDGSSTGGRIVFVDHQQRIAIGIDWLTGRVSVVNGS